MSISSHAPSRRLQMTVKVLSSLQTGGFAGQNSLSVASPVSKVLKWLVHCSDICGPLCTSTTKTIQYCPSADSKALGQGFLTFFCAMHPFDSLVQPTYGPLIRKMHFNV